MTPEELKLLVEEMQRRQSELDNVEVKTAKGGHPNGFTSPCRHSRTGLVAVWCYSVWRRLGISKLWELATLSACKRRSRVWLRTRWSQQLRPQFTVDEIDGEIVAAMEVEEVPATQKPCFCKNAGSY